MNNRESFHKQLKKVCDNVYYQPPSDIKLKYPCIIYQDNMLAQKYANNKLYSTFMGYRVMVIDKDPEGYIEKKILENFIYARWQSRYIRDNLNHTVLLVYFNY